LVTSLSLRCESLPEAPEDWSDEPEAPEEPVPLLDPLSDAPEELVLPDAFDDGVVVSDAPDVPAEEDDVPEAPDEEEVSEAPDAPVDCCVISLLCPPDEEEDDCA
jgi:hypothetical protein